MLWPHCLLQIKQIIAWYSNTSFHLPHLNRHIQKEGIRSTLRNKQPRHLVYIYQLSLTQWIDSTGKTTFDAILYELAMKRFPRWLELEMRNLQPATLNDLKEAVTRYLGNQRREGDGRKTEQKQLFKPTPQHTHNKSKSSEQKQFYSEKGTTGRQKKESKLNVFGVAGRGT